MTLPLVVRDVEDEEMKFNSMAGRAFHSSTSQLTASAQMRGGCTNISAALDEIDRRHLLAPMARINTGGGGSGGGSGEKTAEVAAEAEAAEVEAEAEAAEAAAEGSISNRAFAIFLDLDLDDEVRWCAEEEANAAAQW